MRLITNTNILVDDFDYCKNFAKNTFHHFLTHFHQDHWFGLTPNWDYGPIYCSEITKKLILIKFPKVERFIKAFALFESNDLVLNNNKDPILIDSNGKEEKYFLKIRFTFFDAHHIPGSIMILFEGFMGKILHTGDFRFQHLMFEENKYLFEPTEDQSNIEKNKTFRKTEHNLNYRTKLNIDELIFDNTYCDPLFDFPKTDMACDMIIDIIQKNQKKHILIIMGALGKEDICFKLCKKFQTLIVLNENKYKNIEALNLRSEIFTIHKNEGWIELISKKERLKRLEEEKNNNNLDNIICINVDFLMMKHQAPDGVNFLVPYSLHSNFEEMKAFIKVVRPAILRKLVVPFERFASNRNKKIDHVQAYKNYIKNLNKNGKSGYTYLKNNYTDLFNLSNEYRVWMNEENQKKLKEGLGLLTEPNISLRKRKVKDPQQVERIMELENLFKPKVKKKNLNDIAKELKSTNRNESIFKFLNGKNKYNINYQEEKTEEKKKEIEIAFEQEHKVKINIIDDKVLSLLNDFSKNEKQ